MSLRYQCFAISSQVPIIWKDILFIFSVWFFFAANGKSVFSIIAIAEFIQSINTKEQQDIALLCLKTHF